MEAADVTNLPAGWSQISRPSPWHGMHVLHLSAPDTEQEYEMQGKICISLHKQVAQRYECRARSGRWQEFSIGIGDISFIPADRPDTIRWQGITGAVNLILDTAWMSGGGATTSDALLFDKVTHGIRDEVTSRLLEEIYKDNERGLPYGLAYSESLALCVAFRMSALAMRRPEGRTVDKKALRIDRALDFMHAHMQQPVSLADIAHAAGYEDNLHSFTRAFKRYCGKAPHQYLLDLRLEQARSLLAGGRLSVTQVALSCGFNNLSHFSAAFRGRWGTAPSTLLPKKVCP